MKNKKYFMSVYPHEIVFYVILSVTFFALVFTIVLKDTFIGNIISNVFAGLVSGLVLLLISAVKNRYVKMLDEKHKWFLSFSEKYHQIGDRIQKKSSDFDDSDEYYYYMQDTCVKIRDLINLLREEGRNNNVLGKRCFKEIIGDYSISTEVNRIDDIYVKLNNCEEEIKGSCQYVIFKDSYYALRGVNKRIQDVIRQLTSILSSVE